MTASIRWIRTSSKTRRTKAVEERERHGAEALPYRSWLVKRAIELLDPSGATQPDRSGAGWNNRRREPYVRGFADLRRDPAASAVVSKRVGDLVDVAEAVLEHGSPIAVGCVERPLETAGSGSHGLLVRGVNVFNVYVKERGEGSSLRGGTDQDDRVAEVHVCRPSRFNLGGGAEDIPQELHRLLDVGHEHAGSDAAIGGWRLAADHPTILPPARARSPISGAQRPRDASADYEYISPCLRSFGAARLSRGIWSRGKAHQYLSRPLQLGQRRSTPPSFTSMTSTECAPIIQRTSFALSSTPHRGNTARLPAAAELATGAAAQVLLTVERQAHERRW